MATDWRRARFDELYRELAPRVVGDCRRRIDGGTGNSLFRPTFVYPEGADVTTGTFVSTWPGSDCGLPVPTWLQLTEPLGSKPASDYEDRR